MDAFETEVLYDAQIYMKSNPQFGKDEKIPELVAQFAVEQFKVHRNYPSTFTKEKIKEDLMKHKSTIVMMAVDCYSHYGAEGEVSHGEKNITRSYENPYISKSLLDKVMPFVDFFNY